MDLSALMMGLSALVQLGTGVSQAIGGAKAGKEDRPMYEMPEEIKQLLGIAQQQAYGDMPGYGQAVSNIEQQAATGFSRAENVAQSGSDLLGYVAASGVGQNRAMNDLAATNAAYRSQQQDALQDALRIVSGYRDKEFELNKLMPFQESQDASAVLREGGIQNMFGGLNSIASYYLLKDIYGFGGDGKKKKVRLGGAGDIYDIVNPTEQDNTTAYFEALLNPSLMQYV
jgi:hypothetical protein